MTLPYQQHRTGRAAVPAAPPPYIHCEDLFKIYKTDELEVVALLNILAGLDQPSAGRVSVGERDLLTATDDDLVRYRRVEVGFVWQQTGRNLIAYLTAQQNVEVPMILEGRGRRDAGERARWLLDQVGLSDKYGRHPQELSGGEQQRVAIAVALANDPPLLLADEPTGELDSATANEVFAVLRNLNRETGVTVVIVTHDRTITQRVDRVVAMRDGRTSTEIIRRTQYARGTGETIDEFAVVDRSGRLQIPREYLEQLEIGARARVHLSGDHVEVRSELAGPERERTDAESEESA